MSLARSSLASQRRGGSGLSRHGFALLGSILAVPAAAASGKVVDQRWQNDIPYNKRCSTAVVTSYNASNAPVKSVSIFWFGRSPRGYWVTLGKGIGNGKWHRYPTYIAPGKTYKLRTWVCAKGKNPDGMSVKPANLKWQWY